MCGICGVYEYERDEPVDQQTLLDMLRVITHRGPDDDGTYFDQGCALGMRRLSIIDLAGGQQPMANEDGSIVVVFNGEIYNFPELTARLKNRGHRFKTNSDTEVIVHLYEDLGERCVDELRGMFGFAVWDRSRRKLFLARDRLGIKPLYYADLDGRLVFGSEIKAILRHPGVPARADLQGLSDFLSLKYVPSPETMFADVSALPPGHTLSCDPDGVSVRRYWDLSFAPDPRGRRSEAEYAEELATLLRESVRIHLISDVPFGAFLSGGVDSSTIVALMSQILEQPVKTYAVGFEGHGVEEFSELPYARMVAERYRTDHHEVFVRPEHMIDLAEKVIWHLDQPIADEASLGNYMVAELAARDVKMVLTGEGGDELFAGYARYAGEKFAEMARRVPGPARALALAAARRLPGLRRPKIALFALCQTDEVARLTNWFPLFNRDTKAALLSDWLKRELDGTSTDRIFAEHLARTDASDPLHRMLYVDTKLWLVDDLLARGDKMSMAASLEARVPLLDHKLVEFAARVPADLKVHGMTRKYLLKEVARRWLPDAIIDRKKQGFPMPMSIWFRKEARDFLRDHLAPDAIRRRQLFDPAYVARLLDEHDAGFADHGSLLWALLSVELWFRLYIDAPAPARAPAVAAVRGA